MRRRDEDNFQSEQLLQAVFTHYQQNPNAPGAQAYVNSMILQQPTQLPNCDGVIIDGQCTGGIKSPIASILENNTVTQLPLIPAPIQNYNASNIQENKIVTLIKENPKVALGAAVVLAYFILKGGK